MKVSRSMIVFLYGLLLQAHTPEGVFFFKEPAHIPAVNPAGVQKAKAIAALREVEGRGTGCTVSF